LTSQSKSQMLHTGYMITSQVNKVSKASGFHNVTLEVNKENFFGIMIHVFGVTC
jgi:hypothetical protein